MNRHIGLTGGITSYCSGSIKKCINLSDVNLYRKYESSILSEGNAISVGGIYSNDTSTTIVESCINMGNINFTDISNVNSTRYVYVGGITGITAVGLSNCYNCGNISAISDNVVFVGGITGRSYYIQIKNCYNTGNVICTSNNENSYFGAITGKHDGQAENIKNSYYLIKNGLSGIGNGSEEMVDIAKTEEEMKNANMIELLNQDNEGMWKRDTNNINNGYPILSWQ